MKLPVDPQKMLEQAKVMQERMKQDVASIRVETSTGGGMVTIKMDGSKNVLRLTINPDAMDDVEMLQDMLRGAFNEAVKRVDEQTQSKVSGLIGGLGLPPGLLGG